MLFQTWYFRWFAVFALLLGSFGPAVGLDWIDNCRDQSGGGAGLWFGDCPAYDDSETNWQFNTFPGPTDNAFIGAEFGIVVLDGYPNEATVMSIDAMGGLDISYSGYGLILTDGFSTINGLNLVSGSISAHAGVILDLQGDSYLHGSFFGPGEIYNLGNTSLNYGKLRLGASMVNQSAVTLTSGHFSMNDGDTEFENEGSFEIGGTSTEIRGGSSLFINNGSIAFHRPDFTFYIHPSYEQSGNLFISGGTLRLNSLRTNFKSGEVTVQSGATLLLAGSSSADQDHRFTGLSSLGGNGVVENNKDYLVEGALTISMGSGDPESGTGGFHHKGELNMDAEVYNSGRFFLDSGTITSLEGAFFNEPGGWVYTRSSGGGEIGGLFFNGGSFQVGGASVNIISGEDSYGDFYRFFNNGTINFKGGHFSGEGFVINNSLLTVNLDNPNATSNINNIFLPASGTVKVFSGNLHFTNSIQDLDVTNSLLKHGTWIALPGTHITFPITVRHLGGNAKLVGSASSYPNVDLESIEQGGELESEEWETLGDLFNEGGSLQVPAGGNGVRVNGTLTNIEGGTVGVESGAELEADHLQNGSADDSVVSELASIVVLAKALGEPATVTTPLLDNHGRVAPGEPNGISSLHLIGNLVQHPTGVLDIDLNGAVPDSLHDQLTIAGNATLDGLVNVRLESGFWPTEGQEFTILTVTGTISGTFAGVDSPLGASFSMRHEVDRVVLITEEVFGPSPVPEVSTGFQLVAAYPNPFNPSTTLGFDLPRELPVSLRIFDVSGRLVRELLRGRIEPQGHGQVSWDGRDDRGSQVPAGVYFYRLEAGEYMATKRMTMVK